MNRSQTGAATPRTGYAQAHVRRRGISRQRPETYLGEMEYESDRDEIVAPVTHGWSAFGDGPAELLGPLSPELALVSEELAAVARAFLPDRPWEAFLAPIEPRDPGSRAGLAEAILPAVSVAAVRPTVGPSRTPAATRQHGRSPSRGRTAVRGGQLVAGVAVLVLLVVSSLPIVRDGPTLVTEPLSASSGSARAPNTTASPPVPRVSVPRKSEPLVPVKPAPSVPAVPTKPAAPASSEPAGSAPAAPTGQTLPTRSPLSGGYIAPSLRFRVTPDGAAIVDVVVASLCGSGPPLPSIPIKGGSFERTVYAGSAMVTLSGRFIGRDRARGVARVKNGECASGVIAFTARVS